MRALLSCTTQSLSRSRWRDGAASPSMHHASRLTRTPHSGKHPQNDAHHRIAHRTPHPARECAHHLAHALIEGPYVFPPRSPLMPTLMRSSISMHTPSLSGRLSPSPGPPTPFPCAQTSLIVTPGSTTHRVPGGTLTHQMHACPA